MNVSTPGRATPARPALFGGGRVPRTIRGRGAYGDVDELNSAIGVVRATAPAELFDPLLEAIQRDLFSIGGRLATPEPEKVAKAIEKAELPTGTGGDRSSG